MVVSARDAFDAAAACREEGLTGPVVAGDPAGRKKVVIRAWEDADGVDEGDCREAVEEGRCERRLTMVK